MKDIIYVFKTKYINYKFNKYSGLILVISFNHREEWI